MLTFNCTCVNGSKQFARVSFTDMLFLKRLKHRTSAKSTKQLYQTLGVNEDCEDETLRLAFIHLAKQFHPDSGTLEADAVRFAEVESAYREIRKLRNDLKESNSQLLPDVEEFDIKHTAPQHRHYLNYDVGIGTPSKRQRLHTIERAQKAVENVMEHRLKKLQAEERNTLIGMDKKRAQDIKTRYGMDRLVEDLIQEAMNKGEFSDLPGIGKPLKNINRPNPYVDFTTHKLNQVLIENGFTPEWIQLSKEIREETTELQKLLIEARNELGLIPLNLEEKRSWTNTIENLKPFTKKLNNKIDKYNLLVPILQKQMLHVNLETLAEQVLSKEPVRSIKQKSAKNNINNTYNNNDNLDIFNFFQTIFRKKIT
ncbi:dnaJ subfamily C member 28 [Vespula squamosa]|uniref:DnaJ subfamily C member 28 n=1 Tax=Vespula squamosa TaxID=30214 RepID=A0ABD2A7N5_VESSQ